jgi:hypothetical protein
MSLIFLQFQVYELKAEVNDQLQKKMVHAMRENAGYEASIHCVLNYNGHLDWRF